MEYNGNSRSQGDTSKLYSYTHKYTRIWRENRVETLAFMCSQPHRIRFRLNGTRTDTGTV